MKGSEIRKRFIEYFERNGHKVVHSSPLLPTNDPTLLFVNAGMNQFKDVFLGNEKRDYSRAVSSQKCIRAGGKHNDLDEVGKTARHHTFFEMLGNFSFGDYFKEDAIRFAWDFLVNDLGLEVSRLWFSVYEGDEEVPADTEAENLWIKMGADPSRVLKFGRKDNFWQMGETGPCGPCTEIHYYMGENPLDPAKNRADLVNADNGDMTMEIWNLVFMQFDRSEDGKGGYILTDLPAPSVDTGMGLERITAVLQNVSTNYETDLIKPIIDFTAELSDKSSGKNETYDGFNEKQKFACRVIADHSRATAFSISDGILPGNEGRNYVLRKIMRRAIYNGREHLGFNQPFFYKVCEFVVDQMKDAYPELGVQRAFISKMVRLEEERFSATMTVGLRKLDELAGIGKTQDFTELARLYDTFGTPKDLIRVVLEGKGQNFSASEFEDKIDTAIDELQRNSSIGKTQRNERINPTYKQLEESGIRSTFHGYDQTKIANTKVLALIHNDKRVERLNSGEEGLIVISDTPFYAESGGQVGDRGVIGGVSDKSADVSSDNDFTSFRAIVFDTFAPVAGITLHKSKVEQGAINVGETVSAEVDVEKRDATRRNHTATHLLHAALKEILGTHVKQAGSIVAPDYLRFDFTHYQPLLDNEIEEIEDLVNRYVLQNHNVTTDLMSIEEAMRTGAVALFGEKYGTDVRVLSVGDGSFSMELCGGTHVSATGNIGTFKILSDEAIASGVRRIRAITGFDSLNRFRDDEELLSRSLEVLKTQRDNLPSAIERLQEEIKRIRKENDDLRLKIATGAIGNGAQAESNVREIQGIKVQTQIVNDLDANGTRQLSDTMLARLKSGIVIIGRINDEKVGLIARVSDDLTEKLRAGDIIREMAIIVGGKGGGKADMAEGGGTKPENLSEAIDASHEIIEKLLEK